MRGSIAICSTANSSPLDHRTTASGISFRCSFGSVTVSERASPGRIGKSPEGHHHQSETPSPHPPVTKWTQSQQEPQRRGEPDQQSRCSGHQASGHERLPLIPSIGLRRHDHRVVSSVRVLPEPGLYFERACACPSCSSHQIDQINQIDEIDPTDRPLPFSYISVLGQTTQNPEPRTQNFPKRSGCFL
jgi:hypothetical protein